MRLCEAFANGSSTNMKLAKPQLYKIGQSGEFLDKLSEKLLKKELPLIGNAIKPLTKSVLIPLGLTPAASATYAAAHKIFFDLIIRY